MAKNDFEALKKLYLTCSVWRFHDEIHKNKEEFLRISFYFLTSLEQYIKHNKVKPVSDKTERQEVQTTKIYKNRNEKLSSSSVML